MKALIKTLPLALILAAAITGCSKSNKSSSSASSSSWTLSDSTYTSTTTGFTNKELLGIDSKVSSTPEIGIQFADTPTTGSYTVVNQYNVTVGSNQCSILESVGTSTFVSTSGGTVAVVVSKGKISATFKNVEMGILSGINNNGTFTFADAGSSSGTLTEQ